MFINPTVVAALLKSNFIIANLQLAENGVCSIRMSYTMQGNRILRCRSQLVGLNSIPWLNIVPVHRSTPSCPALTNRNHG